MQSEAAEIGSGCAPARQPKERLWTIDALDGRTLSARRARELAAAFEAEIGGTITPTQRLEIERAARLTAVAEDLAVRRLRGEAVSVNDVVRIDGAAVRAVRALRAQPRPEPPRKTLQDVIAEIEASRTATEGLPP